jgi:hypothetical protein
MKRLIFIALLTLAPLTAHAEEKRTLEQSVVEILGLAKGGSQKLIEGVKTASPAVWQATRQRVKAEASTVIVTTSALALIWIMLLVLSHRRDWDETVGVSIALVGGVAVTIGFGLTVGIALPNLLALDYTTGERIIQLITGRH